MTRKAIQDVDYVLLGRRIRMVRESIPLRQADVASRMECSISFYGHIERGSRKASISTLFRISQVLEVSVDQLLFGNEELDRGDWFQPFIIISPSEPSLYALVKTICENKKEWLPE